MTTPRDKAEELLESCDDADVLVELHGMIPAKLSAMAEQGERYTRSAQGALRKLQQLRKEQP